MSKPSENNEGFVACYNDRVNHFYQAALKNHELYRKLMGTKVVISRVIESSKYDDVFGKKFSSELTDDHEVEKKSAILLLPINKIVSTSRTHLDSYELVEIIDHLNLGDIITYEIRGREFKDKCVDKKSFSLKTELTFTYTMQAMSESKSKS